MVAVTLLISLVLIVAILFLRCNKSCQHNLTSVTGLGRSQHPAFHGDRSQHLHNAHSYAGTGCSPVGLYSPSLNGSPMHASTNSQRVNFHAGLVNSDSLRHTLPHSHVAGCLATELYRRRFDDAGEGGVILQTGTLHSENILSPQDVRATSEALQGNDVHSLVSSPSGSAWLTTIANTLMSSGSEALVTSLPGNCLVNGGSVNVAGLDKVGEYRCEAVLPTTGCPFSEFSGTIFDQNAKGTVHLPGKENIREQAHLFMTHEHQSADGYCTVAKRDKCEDSDTLYPMKSTVSGVGTMETEG
ncbi:unnamed protein product [Protopolystoma xenopodis]|uniref:Ig-like domain-containing protein n=1 Tax=Protopolystoma xenopodis TaxID=117903 RepID=A0A3S5FC73_9PLAT|nr:unnamed protein product [Protopolystoma xenopodis]